MVGKACLEKERRAATSCRGGGESRCRGGESDQVCWRDPRVGRGMERSARGERNVKEGRACEGGEGRVGMLFGWECYSSLH